MNGGLYAADHVQRFWRLLLTPELQAAEWDAAIERAAAVRSRGG